MTGTLIPKWPDRFDPNRGPEIPTELIGATIIAFGTSEERIEGGGLFIDYRPRDNNEVHRVVLAFNELGMWVHRQSILNGGQESDL